MTTNEATPATPVAFKLTRDNYFDLEASRLFMGSTQYKTFNECESRAIAVLAGEWEEEEKTAFLQGKYVHAWNEGTLPQFIVKNPSIFKKNSDELLKTYKICNDVIDTIEGDEMFVDILSGQKEVIFQAEMFGVMWKVMHDSYDRPRGRFADLKVLDQLYKKFWSVEAGCYQNVLEFRGYLTQMAIYAEVERIATGSEKCLKPHLAIATKQTPPDKIIVDFDNEIDGHNFFVEDHLAVIKIKLPHIIAVKAGEIEPVSCNTCDYCRATKVLTKTVHYSEFYLN